MKQILETSALITLLSLSLSASLNAQSTDNGAVGSEPVKPGVYEGDVRDLRAPPPWKEGDGIRDVNPKRVYPRSTNPSEPSPPVPSPPDPLLDFQGQFEESLSARVFTTPNLNFEGTAFTGVVPPDTVGEVGPNHYIQMVNSATGSQVAIYDKAGSPLATFDLDSLWTAGGACASGTGDPIVLHDSLADRWLLSEFADTGNHLCVYITRTADPVSGGYFLYDFAVPEFPDYPKYAVWPDAYYVSSNESSPAAYALDRIKMLGGLPATFQRFTAPSLAAFGFQALTPGDLDGPTAPPLGSPNYFIRHRDDEAHNPGTNDPTQDFVDIFQFHVDFVTPTLSTFTGPVSIPVAEFDSELCGFSSFFCFPQPGTTRTLDPLREVVMWRLQYRNFGTHETLVGNFVTDVDGTDHGGIRWFELRKTGVGPWTLFQQGTQAPDSDNRWMGSIAMDKAGNIALGYSVSSTSVFPSIRYAGREAVDPAGTLPQGEASIIAGAVSQTGSTRWGDYSSMNVDPADDCTFWYTNEYVGAGGLWRTRIASFNFPSCLALPPPPPLPPPLPPPPLPPPPPPPPPVLCNGLLVTIVGDGNSNTIFGTPGNDVIHGLAGNDAIAGLGGNDVICGGPGRDRLSGNSGNDKLFGDAGNDRLKGGVGRDRLFGQGGRDTMDGQSGTDRCNGGSGTDSAIRCENTSGVP